MSSLPLAAKAALAAVLLASIVRGFAGRPARCPRPRAARGLLLLAFGAYALIVPALAFGWAPLGAALAMTGVELACCSAWLERGSARDDDDDGDDRRHRPQRPSPVGWDWDEFDRVRRAWEQERTAR